MKMMTAKREEQAQIIANIGGTITLILTALMIVVSLSNCTVSASLDWVGKTEVKKTTSSPTTIEKHVLW